MTPEKTTIVKALIAFAWADGRVTPEEEDVVDTMLTALEATPEEKAQLKSYAETPRTLDDIEAQSLTSEQREVLVTNAAILCRADGEESPSEVALLRELGEKLGLEEGAFNAIVSASSNDAVQLLSEALVPIPPPRKH